MLFRKGARQGSFLLEEKESVMIQASEEYIAILSGTDWSEARRYAARVNCRLGIHNLLDDPEVREYISVVGRQCNSNRYLRNEGLILWWAIFELIPIL